MTKPCAVFWDIQNIDAPEGQSVNSIVDLIRSTIIKPHNLDEIFFFCVCDVHKLPSNVDHSLTNVDFQSYDEVSANIKILDLMRKFVSSDGPDCTIILLSGDADYYGTLSDLKNRHNVSIYLIRLADSPSHKLDQIADHIFILNDGVLKPVEPPGSQMCFILIQYFPFSFNISQVVNKLNAQANGIIKNSAIIYDGAICIGFSTLENAEKAIEQIKGFRYKAGFLTAKLIIDSLLAEILKCIKPEVVMQTKSIKEVKQLTFIKVFHSDEAYKKQIFKFCIAYAAQSGSQCVLSVKRYHWIVFLFKSDAQKFLPKVKMIYSDAVIVRPWVDVESTRHESPYFVESCGEIYTNEAPSSVASLDARDEWSIFFRYNPDFTAPVQYYEPTKWSLLYNLFEKLYDLGAKKVIFDGNFYCAHFDSMSAYQDAFDRIRSRYLEPLEFVPVSEIHTKQEVKDPGAKKVIFDGNLYCAQFDSASYRDAFEKIQSRYLEPLESVDASEAHKLKAAKRMIRCTGTPWCLNEQLGLSCLVIKIESQFHAHFMEISKSILGNRECIFIKSIPGEIWIGFPDENTCKNSEKNVDGFVASLKQQNDMSIAKPSKELLESINLQDLAGDAYDLAFLSSQLEVSKPIKRPNFIEQIRLQRIQEQECNESVFHFTVSGQFYSRWTSHKLQLEQIVKIFVNFSKVIPLAATASVIELNLIYNSWHEASLLNIS